MAVKVLHVVHWPRTGITSLLASLFAAFDTVAIENYLFIVDANAQDLAPFNGLVVGADCGGGGLVNAAIQFAKMVRSIKPDIIHTHSFTPSLMAGLMARHIPHVRTFHSEYPYFSSNKLIQRLKKKIEQRVLNRPSTSVVCVSSGVERSLPYKFDRCRLITIRNGLPLGKILDLARLGEARDRVWGGCAARTIIVSTGRLEHQKGYDVLIQSMALIPENIRATLLLVLIGEGSQKALLEQIVSKNCLENEVKLLGYQENPYKFLRVSDIYICSSRYEGYGLSLAEAMVLGLPVVTTRVSGVPEMLIDDETGVLIAELTPPQIAQALLKLVENKVLANHVALSGQQFARKEMDVKSVADEHIALYQEILHEQR